MIIQKLEENWDALSKIGIEAMYESYRNGIDLEHADIWLPLDEYPPNMLEPVLGYKNGLKVPYMVFWLNEKMDGTGTYPCVLGIGELYGDFYKKICPTHWQPIKAPK